MRKYWLAASFICLTAGIASGQNTILFQSRILDSKTFASLPGSHVSVNRDLSYLSDDNGGVAIYVRVNDTLTFSRTGYKPFTVIISDTLPGKNYVSGIFMSSDTIEIGEVVIMPRFSNLRSEILNSPVKHSSEIENARYNVAISAYQGRTTTGKMGDPETNYQVLRQQQKMAAFEKGGIPSDRIAGISPFMLIPAIELLMKGLPEKPTPFKPDMSDKELDQIIKQYLEKQRK